MLFDHRARRRVSLTRRILAVNIVALALLAVSLLSLDSYRRQLLAERVGGARGEAEVAAVALLHAGPERTRTLLAGIAAHENLRLIQFDAHAALVADSFALAGPTYQLADPARSPLLVKAARTIDRGMDAILGTASLETYRPRADDARADRWPEVGAALRTAQPMSAVRFAPDRTPLISIAAPLGPRASRGVLLVLRNDPDFTQNVRNARQTLGIVVATALAISVALSLFLARTIVEPLRQLVRAAVRVRLGRERAVEVPRLPERRDEIGLLARALSDMSLALRHRIDAVEAFAADVAHEIKNPLASLRSALESLDKVEDGGLLRQLTAIAAHDIQRIDRLITEISDASRIDAELSRTTFEPIDLAALARGIVATRAARGADGDHPISVTSTIAVPRVGGDPARLERVFANLLDNAVSFSPPGGAIGVAISGEGGRVIVEVTDEGPGIPPGARPRIFDRFYSRRPSGEEFGGHSGLGLAIARTIVEAHDGTLTAEPPHPPGVGARLVLALPAWHARAA